MGLRLRQLIRLLVIGSAATELRLAAELSCAPTSTLKDGGFELATGSPLESPHWSASYTNFNPICTVGPCSFTSAGPRSGVNWAWFYGDSSISETATLAQTLAFPLRTEVELSFYMRIVEVSPPFDDTLEIQVDGATVVTIYEPLSNDDFYVLRTVDLSAHVDGGAHVVRFLFTHLTGGNSSITVDDVRFNVKEVVVFEDGGFELASGKPPVSPVWEESSSTYGSPICTPGYCVDPLSEPRSGDNWTWFTGSGGGDEDASLSQVVFLPAHALIDWLTYLRISQVDTPFTDTLALKIDDSLQLTIPEPAIDMASYAQIPVALDLWSDGDFHAISYDFHAPAGGGAANFLVDDIAVEIHTCLALLLDGFETHDTSNWSGVAP